MHNEDYVAMESAVCGYADSELPLAMRELTTLPLLLRSTAEISTVVPSLNSSERYELHVTKPAKS